MTQTETGSGNTTPGEPLLYTIREAAESLRVSTHTVYQLCLSGDLPSLKLGRRRYVRPADLTAFVAALSTDGGTA